MGILCCCLVHSTSSPVSLTEVQHCFHSGLEHVLRVIVIQFTTVHYIRMWCSIQQIQDRPYVGHFTILL